MAEAIISRRGGGGASGGNLQTEIISFNTIWVAPAHKGNVSVRLFGGGASGARLDLAQNEHNGCQYCGGGSGWMNNGEFNIPNGSQVVVTIGAGGIPNNPTNAEVQFNSGGTSSFGTYLSANGGSGMNGGAGGGMYYMLHSVESYIYSSRAYQFGGGGVCVEVPYYAYSGGSTKIIAGYGGIWGGGGGIYTDEEATNEAVGGAGGTYGGGGGAYTANRSGNATNGKGGTYGGNGGSKRNDTNLTMAEDGTNTLGNTSVPSNCRGDGKCGSYNNNAMRYLAGGGGFGGRGGNGDTYGGLGGGGGGYGGNGGS